MSWELGLVQLQVTYLGMSHDHQSLSPFNILANYDSLSMGCYFLFLNYPARFVIFGLALIGIGYIMGEFEYTAPVWSSTRIWGLLYHFLALWTLSLFGNDALVSDSQKEGGQTRRFV